MDKPYDFIDSIIDEINPAVVPPEFIIMAKVVMTDGEELLMSGYEFESFLEREGDEVVDISVILNVKKIRDAVMTETEKILNEVFNK